MESSMMSIIYRRNSTIFFTVLSILAGIGVFIWLGVTDKFNGWQYLSIVLVAWIIAAIVLIYSLFKMNITGSSIDDRTINIIMWISIAQIIVLNPISFLVSILLTKELTSKDSINIL